MLLILLDSNRSGIKPRALHLEEWGYSAIWVPDMGGPLFEDLTRLLRATESVVIGTAALNIWLHTPAEVSRWRASLSDVDQRRVILGVGVGHRALVGDLYRQPLSAMRTFLVELERLDVPMRSVLVAALGPKMLALAAELAGGAVPYLVTPDHSASSRLALGSGALAVMQAAVVDNDRGRGLALARSSLELYGGLANYTDNWLRMGYSQPQVSAASEVVVADLVAVGSSIEVDERLGAHRQAGADHVALAASPNAGEAMPWTAWRALAPAHAAADSRPDVE